MTPTGTRAAAQQADPVAAPVRAFGRVFPAVGAQVREARHFVAGILGGCPVADDAIACVSELATNACLHSASARPGGTFTVRVLICRGGCLRVEVADEGGPWVSRAHGDDWLHGLAIVASLAADSGVRGDPVTGWTCWAAFSCPSRDQQGGKTMTDPVGPAASNRTPAPPDGNPRPRAGRGGAAAPSGLSGPAGCPLFRLSQALEDAIVFRRARAGTYCADCDDAPGGSRCDDHAGDLALIAGYEEDARAVNAAIAQDTSRRLSASAR